MEAGARAETTRSGAGPSDAALVVAARGGEEWAFEALFRRHARSANGLAFRVMGRDSDVDDIVQEGFAQAFDRLGEMHEPQAFLAFLLQVIVRVAGKIIRRRRLMRRLGLGGVERAVDAALLQGIVPSSTVPPDEAAELRRVYAIVDQLPADARLALILRRVEGYPLEEVANLVGCSLATVKRRIADADRVLARHGSFRDGERT